MIKSPQQLEEAMREVAKLENRDLSAEDKRRKLDLEADIAAYLDRHEGTLSRGRPREDDRSRMEPNESENDATP